MRILHGREVHGGQWPVRVGSRLTTELSRAYTAGTEQLHGKLAYSVGNLLCTKEHGEPLGLWCS